jgi:hypothetical protein
VRSKAADFLVRTKIGADPHSSFGHNEMIGCIHASLAINQARRVLDFIFPFDIALSDCHLFREIKIVLNGFAFKDDHDLPRRGTEVWSGAALQRCDTVIGEGPIR